MLYALREPANSVSSSLRTFAAVVRIEGIDDRWLHPHADEKFGFISPSFDQAVMPIPANGAGAQLLCSDAGSLNVWFALPSDAIVFALRAIEYGRPRFRKVHAAIHVEWTSNIECDAEKSGFGLLAAALDQAGGHQLIVSTPAVSMLLGSGLQLGRTVAELPRPDDEPLQFMLVHLEKRDRSLDGGAGGRPPGRRANRQISPLSVREREVASLVAEGRTNRDVARLLSIATSTVERHLTSLFGKLNVRSRVEIATLAAVGQL